MLTAKPIVMRLFPAAVLNARVANKDSTLPSGGGKDSTSRVFVRKGDIVVFSTWAQHRLSQDFGENLDEFYPERWEKLSVTMPAYIPFNRGPRVCPGRKSLLSLTRTLTYPFLEQYALVVLTYLVTRLFQNFSTVVDYNAGPWTERISITLENDNGVLVGLC